MVVTVTVENLVFLAAVFLVRNLAHHLEDLLIGLRSGVAVVDAAHARHLRDQLLGKFGPGDRTRCLREVAHLHQLFLHRIGNAFTAIANVDGPDRTGNGIDVFFAVLVPDPHAFAFDDDARLGFFKGFVLGQVMPDVGAVCVNHCLNIVVTGAVHGTVLSS